MSSKTQARPGARGRGGEESACGCDGFLCFRQPTHPTLTNRACFLRALQRHARAGSSKAQSSLAHAAHNTAMPPTTTLPTPIDATRARTYPAVPHAWTERDAILYALSVGAPADDLPHTYEGDADFAPLPTFPLTLPYHGVTAAVPFEDVVPNFSPLGVLHGEQYLELSAGPLPATASVVTTPRVVDVQDKGRAAVIVVGATTACASTGRVIAYQEITVFARGAGGFGAVPPPPTPRRAAATAAHTPPARPPDFSVEQATPANVAALYRLTGDTNPLHVDKEFAALASFDRPIAHGLCTLGFAVRHVIAAAARGDASLIRSVKARMAAPVFPGETLVTRGWVVDGARPGWKTVVFVVSVKERGVDAITAAGVEVGPAPGAGAVAKL